MKCGFFDCNNQVEKGQNSCQSCGGGKREEWKICSSCRQPSKGDEHHIHRDSLLLNKLHYQFVAKMRDKAPSQFQTEFDPVLSDLKLSEVEKKLIHQAEKVVLDFLTEKGGQQDNSNWFNFCSVCIPELDNRMENFVKKHPEMKSLMNRIKKAMKEKLKTISEKIEQAIGKEKWDEIGEKVVEEAQEEVGDNWRDENYDPTSPGDKGPNKPNQRDNNNSAKINQLQQEVNSLKQEIRNLKSKPHDPSSPNSDNSDALQEKERKLREKERDLEKLKKEDKGLNQPSSNNPNLPLYIFGGGVILVIFLIVVGLLISKKKKKKRFNSIIYAYSK